MRLGRVRSTYSKQAMYSNKVSGELPAKGSITRHTGAGA